MCDQVAMLRGEARIGDLKCIEDFSAISPGRFGMELDAPMNRVTLAVQHAGATHGTRRKFCVSFVGNKVANR
jgi:hypothetical protein